jgi:F-type H+-transporting ATPase subunit alpha
MPIAEQVVLMYAGTQGYVDALEVEEVGGFAGELLAFVRERHPRVLERIRQSGELSEEAEQELKAATQDCCDRHGAESSHQEESGGAT